MTFISDKLCEFCGEPAAWRYTVSEAPDYARHACKDMGHVVRVRRLIASDFAHIRDLEIRTTAVEPPGPWYR